MEDPLGIAGVLIALYQVRNNLHVFVGLEQAVVGHFVEVISGYRVVQVGGHAGGLIGSSNDQRILRRTGSVAGTAGLRRGLSSLLTGRRSSIRSFSASGTARQQADSKGQRQCRRQTAHCFFHRTSFSSFLYLHSRQVSPRPDASAFCRNSPGFIYFYWYN